MKRAQDHLVCSLKKGTKVRSVRQCEAGHCGETSKHLHGWPKDTALADLWTKWVSGKKENFKPDRYSTLCYRHFLVSDFPNMGEYRLALRAQRVIIDNSN